MHFELRRGVSVCDVDDRLIFLDLLADRYFCLASASDHAVRQVMRGAVLTPDDVVCLDGLVERRILVRGSGGGTIIPCAGPVPATHSLIDQPLPDPNMPALSFAVAATLASIARLRLRRLKHNVATAAAAAASDCARLVSTEEHLSRLTRVAAAFDRAAALLSVHDRCLAQSLAVARTARGHGLSVQIVFGVALGPFVAHCWVQSGPLVLNDRLDTIRAYTPILVR